MKVIVKGLPGSGKTIVMEIIAAALRRNDYLVTAVEHGYLEEEEAYSVEIARKEGARNVELGTSL